MVAEHKNMDKTKEKVKKKGVALFVPIEFRETLEKLRKKIEFNAWDSNLHLSYYTLAEILSKRISKTKFLDYDVFDINEQK